MLQARVVELERCLAEASAERERETSGLQATISALQNQLAVLQDEKAVKDKELSE